MKRLLIIVTLALSLSGCSTMFEALDRFRPAGTVVVNTVQTAAAISTVRENYIAARQAVQGDQAVFSAGEWEVLRASDAELRKLATKIDALRAGQQGAEIVITTSELVSLILPARDAANAASVVMDSNFGELSDEAQRAYFDVLQDYGVLDERIKAALATGNNQARADMLIDLLDMVARILGVMSIGLA